MLAGTVTVAGVPAGVLASGQSVLAVPVGSVNAGSAVS